MKITFERYTKFINDLYGLFNESDITYLEISISKSAKFYDLYSFGRFLGTLKHLKNIEDIEISVKVNKWPKNRIRAYSKIGIWDLLSDFLDTTFIESLSQINVKPSNINVISIVRLKKIEISKAFKNFDSINIQVNRILKDLLDESLSSIENHFDFDYSIINILTPYLNHFYFTIVSELISNILKHSNSPEFFFGLTLFRENLIQGDARRKGSKHIVGSYAFDFMIYDSGQGIFNSFKQHFENQNISNKDIVDYYKFQAFSPKHYRPILSYLKVTETNILSNIFSGNLSIRKGRRSDGLYDVSEKLSWHNGIINFFFRKNRSYS